MAEMKSIFYWMPESPPCRTVLVVLKLIEFDDFDYKLIDLSKAEHLSDDYLEMNPFHTIPLWFESGSNLYLNESRTIARYLIETKKPESSLYPLDDVNKRAIINKLMDYELGTLFRHISDVVYPIFKPNQGLPNVEKIPYLKETLETFEKSLENLKDDEYLTGGTDITLADISIYFTMSLLQVIPELIDLSEYSSIYSWLNRMNEFFEQFDEINDNVLKKGQENLINYGKYCQQKALNAEITE